MSCHHCGDLLPEGCRPTRRFCDWRCSRKYNQERREPRICPGCGSSFRADRVVRKYCSQKCQLDVVRTPEHQSYAAHFAGKSNAGKGAQKGYVKVDGRHLHRQIAEEALGRPLKSYEVVHHIDCNKQNNDKSNLLICTQSYHAWLHTQMRKHPGPWSKHETV